MAALFRVKALFEYSSAHEDDLSFEAGQIIAVTEQDDDDWYGGEYVDGSGVKREGIFPRNFVEKFEPTAPPRPARARPKPTHLEGQTQEDSVAQQPPPPPPPPAQEEEVAPAAPADQLNQRPGPPPPPVPVAAAASASTLAVAPPVPPSAAAVPPSPKPPHPAAKPKPAPPPVSEKPSSFKDRIAAFNKPAAPPIAPFKPSSLGGGAGGGNGQAAFVKKPFVAPPPSRNAYVPPPREAPTAKVYHREEDPEVQEQVAENMGQAEKAGLVPPESQPEVGDDDDQPKPTSLKERIALLQKQQLEQAQRHADVAAKKEKPKKPPKKRVDAPSGEEGDDNLPALQSMDSRDSEDAGQRASVDNHRAAPPPPPPPPTRNISDGNEADVSGTGEATEGQDNTTERDENEEGLQQVSFLQTASTVTAEEGEKPAQAVEEEVEGEEEEEEEEVDPEVRRKEELRARMAKMSGGMGFAGMFGGPMASIGALPMKKKGVKPPARQSAVEEEANIPLPHAPPVPVMMALPGMNTLRKQPEEPPRAPEEQIETVQRAPPVPPSAPSERLEEEVVVVAEQQATPLAAPPLPPQPSQVKPEQPVDVPVPPAPVVESELPRPVPTNPPAPSGARRSPPPAPSTPPSSSGARPPPPRPPPLSTITSATEGSESDDELSTTARENSAREASSPALRSPLIPQDPSSQASTLPARSPPQSPPETFPPTSPAAPTRRYSRPPPPIPGAVATLPPVQTRQPPPPPGGVMRQSTSELSSTVSNRLPQAGEETGEMTEYDGDCDTDIASSVHHKDALRSRNRAPSLDDSTLVSPSLKSPPTSDGPPTSLPPIPASSTLRAAPPPVPHHSSPELMRKSSDAPRAAPPLPPTMPPKPTSPNDRDYDQGYVPAAGVLSSSYSSHPSVEDELQDSMFFPGVPRAKSPPERKFVGPGVASRSSNRLSTDGHRTNPTARRSVDHHRPSMDTGFIAGDVDLAIQSGWWKQANQVPPVLQGRKDIYFEYDESTATNADGKTICTRETLVLYQDYSQTVFTARYDPQDAADVELDQRHEGPPLPLRQDQMEDAYDRFGRRIAAAAVMKKDMIVGDGTPASFILELIRPLKEALRPVSTRSYGALVYSNMANASTQQYDVIRAGDVLTIRNAKFQGKHGAMHAKYAMDVGKPDHVAVVAEWDGTKKKVRAWEQGRESKKVRLESYKLDDLRSGEVKIWRVVSRSWVGWKGGEE